MRKEKDERKLRRVTILAMNKKEPKLAIRTQQAAPTTFLQKASKTLEMPSFGLTWRHAGKADKAPGH